MGPAKTGIMGIMGADAIGFKQMSHQLAGLLEAGSARLDLMARHQHFIRLAAYALVVLAALAMLAAVYAGRFIAVPIFAGLVVGLILGPLGDRGQRFGLPKGLTYGLLMLALLGLTALCAWLALPVIQLIVAALPRARARLQDLLAFFNEWALVLENLRAGGAPAIGASFSASAPGTSSVEIATTALAWVTPALSQVLIFVFTLVLFLAGRSYWRGVFVRCFVGRADRLQALKSVAAVENLLTDYFVVVTAINAGLGLLVGSIFWLFDIPAPFSWAVLAFMLNFLPVVGPLFLKLTLLIFGFLVYPDTAHALLPVGLFLIASIIEANLVTPKIVGRRLTIDPLVVFLSVVFFTWLWGFAGAFLAMPLLAIASIGWSREEAVPHLPG